MSLLIPDSGLIFWMVLSFSVVLFILSKFGFPIIVKMVEERKQIISKSLIDAQTAALELETAARQKEAILSAAREEEVKILREAGIIREKIISEAKEEAGRISAQELERARKELERVRQDSLRKARNEMALLSLATAEQILRKNLADRENQLEMINEILKDNIDLRS
ncbi:MAG: F0F1 ATP synthase subunit B [Bacteroidales bacterium]|nr:F0F1 ATP synthase subunit B [Bacteroidales bacterium]MDD2424941.1 F0F1 ATP synthase subunit B [Bacteroidales bacterium]MDD3989093.1 F0F1 ATP synthase subunit B [Bacteroidales bacterium]MDD4638476.1 F0F1 ATP synthase subunit B [Bacteroidales bacterium]